jgi:hypothetical protein
VEFLARALDEFGFELTELIELDELSEKLE